MNSMFELATQDEIDKLRTNDDSKSGGNNSSEELQLDDLEVLSAPQDHITSHFLLGFRQNHAYQRSDVLHH